MPGVDEGEIDWFGELCFVGGVSVGVLAVGTIPPNLNNGVTVSCTPFILKIRYSWKLRLEKRLRSIYKV